MCTLCVGSVFLICDLLRSIQIEQRQKMKRIWTKKGHIKLQFIKFNFIRAIANGPQTDFFPRNGHECAAHYCVIVKVYFCNTTASVFVFWYRIQNPYQLVSFVRSRFDIISIVPGNCLSLFLFYFVYEFKQMSCCRPVIFQARYFAMPIM